MERKVQVLRNMIPELRDKTILANKARGEEHLVQTDPMINVK